MTVNKISRRELLKLLPGSILAALAGVSTAMTAGDEVDETVKMRFEVDAEQLDGAVWDAPLKTVVDAGSGRIADNIDYIDYGILWGHVKGEGRIADCCEHSLVIE